MNKLSSKILISITGSKENHWRNKLEEIDKLKISKIALFLENFKLSQRKKIYRALLNSKVKRIPLVHIRNDMTRNELIFLAQNFYSLYFTIHEDGFKILYKWRGFYKNIFLEMNTDNFVSSLVKVNKIGGFCIDLSHFKVAEEKWSKEFEYIIKRKKIAKYFICNHLNGYSYQKNTDLHRIKSLEDFDYLKTLPKFMFGKIIALETENSISEQLKFKSYLIKLLLNRF